MTDQITIYKEIRYMKLMLLFLSKVKFHIVDLFDAFVPPKTVVDSLELSEKNNSTLFPIRVLSMILN